jgi:hypothetical protein
LGRSIGSVEQLVEPMQVYVRQQRRNDGLNAKDNFEFARVAAYRKEREVLGDD